MNLYIPETLKRERLDGEFSARLQMFRKRIESTEEEQAREEMMERSTAERRSNGGHVQITSKQPLWILINPSTSADAHGESSQDPGLSALERHDMHGSQRSKHRSLVNYICRTVLACSP